MTRKRFIIDITQEVINVATERDSGHCIVADALRASIPGARLVSVDLQTIRWSNMTERKRYIALTPVSAQQILVDFDQGHRDQIVPQTIYVRPSQVIKMSDSSKRDFKAERARSADRKKRLDTSQGSHHIPTVNGGPAPPTAALSNARGKIRRYGLKSLRP